MKIYDALISDHRKVQDILNQIVNLGDSEGDQEVRHELIQKLRDELIPHARSEEAVFYNSIRAVNVAQDLVWHGYEEHMMAESLLRTLQAAEKMDAGWKKVAKKLNEALSHHIREEEERIIPVAKQLFTSQEAEVMNEAFQKMKPEVREEGFMQTTLDMIANMLPPRLAAPLRTFTLRAH